MIIRFEHIGQQKTDKALNYLRKRYQRKGSCRTFRRGRGNKLVAYAASRTSCHEPITMEEVVEGFLGMYVLARGNHRILKPCQISEMNLILEDGLVTVVCPQELVEKGHMASSCKSY